MTHTGARSAGLLAAGLLLAAALAGAFLASPLRAADGAEARQPAPAAQQLPDLDQRYEPGPVSGRFQAYYAYAGAKHWSNWTSARKLEDAKGDALSLIQNGGKYTHAFIVRKKDGKIVWKSW